MQGHFAAISALRAALRAVALRNAPAGAVRAASDLLDAQKVTKKALGGGGNRIRLRLILHDPHPLDPHYGGHPLRQAESFRRAKSEWRSAVPSGPLGPGCVENYSCCDSVSAPAVSEPTSGAVFRCRGAPRAPAGRRGRRLLRKDGRVPHHIFVGAAFGRPRAGLGPAPAEGPENFVGAAHWAARKPSPRERLKKGRRNP